MHRSLHPAGRMRDPYAIVDTPDAIIERLLDFYEEHGLKAEAGPVVAPIVPDASISSNGILTFDPADPPSLRHTKIVKASFNGKDMSHPNWNDLHRHAHEVAFAALGRRFDVRHVYNLARKLGAPIDLTFAWREKPGAQNPGKVGKISWRP